MTETAQKLVGWRRVVVLTIVGGLGAFVVCLVGFNLWAEFGPGAAQRAAWLDCYSSFSATQEMELVELGTDPEELCDQEQAEDPEAFLQSYGD